MSLGTVPPFAFGGDLDHFRGALRAGEVGRASDVLLSLGPRDAADALRDLRPEQLQSLIEAAGADALAAVLERLNSSDAADVLRRLPGADAAHLLHHFAPDDAADVVGAIASHAPGAGQSILVEMDENEAGEVRALLAHPAHTAGRRMTPEYFAVTPQVTVDETVQVLRAIAADTEFRSYVYVTDHLDRLLGVVPLPRLVLAQPDALIGELMSTRPVSVRTTDDQEDVARILRERRLLAVPVVDEQARLVGVVTADDVADVLVAEATEDVQRLAGTQPLAQPYLRVSPLALVRKRVVWLLLLFLGAGYTSTVLSHFEAELQTTVSLAFFIPLLIGTGGNVGSQTVMTVIRALAVGDITSRDLFRVWVKEATAGLLLGAIMALVTFGRALLLGVNPQVGIAVAVAAAAIVVWAAVVAAVLPLALHRLRLDPAVVSAPLITTLVDGTGLFLYLSIARTLIGQ